MSTFSLPVPQSNYIMGAEHAAAIAEQLRFIGTHPRRGNLADCDASASHAIEKFEAWSGLAICRDSAGWATRRRWAALETVPGSATVTKVRA